MTIEIAPLSKIANKVFRGRPRRLANELVDLVSMDSSVLEISPVETDDRLWDAMQPLLKKGANPALHGDFGEYTLEKLCDGRHYRTALKLLAEFPDLKVDQTHGPIVITPLMCALKDKQVELVKVLCERGANVNAGTGSAFNSNNTTAFEILAGGIKGKEQEAIECMKLLMQHGLAIDGPTKKVIYNNASVLAPLVPEVENAVAFRDALEKSDHFALRALLAKGVSIDCCKEYDAEPAIITAARKGDVETINLLLARGASPDTKFKDDSSTMPLHQAALAGQREAFLRLLDAGASPFLIWSDHETGMWSVKGMAAKCTTDPDMANFVQTVLDARESTAAPEVSVNHAIKTGRTIQLKRKPPV